MSRTSASLMALALTVIAADACTAEPAARASASTELRVTTYRASGGRVDWSADGQRIAYDVEGPNRYFEVHTADANGHDDRCVTCNAPGLAQLHNGNPAWHPSGDFLVFQSQDPSLGGLPLIARYYTNPGSGINNNLWLANRDGSRFWRLTAVAKGGGVLHPHFSHDGSKLLWAERVGSQPFPLGQWALKLADVAAADDGLRLDNVRELRPGGLQMYESHGFAPDDRSILFSGCADENFFHSDIYRFDLQTGALVALTDTRATEWDEHAHFLADGEHIVWMSSAGIEQNRSASAIARTDYWIMRADGSDKRRLTWFNDSAAPRSGRVTAADWSPDPRGGRIAAYLIERTGGEGTGPIVLIESPLLSPRR